MLIEYGEHYRQSTSNLCDTESEMQSFLASNLTCTDEGTYKTNTANSTTGCTLESVLTVLTNVLQLCGYLILATSILTEVFCRGRPDGRKLKFKDCLKECYCCSHPKQNYRQTHCCWLVFCCDCCLAIKSYVFHVILAHLSIVAMGILAFAIVKHDQEIAELKENQYIYLLTYFKAFHLSGAILVHLVAVVIFSNSVNKWVKRRSEIALERSIELYTDVNKLGEKYYKLHNSYIATGRRNKYNHDVLKYWFVIHYAAYLMSVLSKIVHLTQRFQSKGAHDHQNDTVATALYIAFHFLSFLVPFLMANLLNVEHNNYYEEMVQEYLTHKVDDNVDASCYTLSPGYQIIPNDRASQQRAKKSYEDYYCKAMQINIARKKEFDFTPSIVAISMPLDSIGHTFAIVLTLFVAVFNFI